MILFILISVLIPILDFAAKFFVFNNLSASDEIKTFIPFLSIVKVKNFGIAFGIFKGQTGLLILFISVILIVLLYLVFSKKLKASSFYSLFRLSLAGELEI